ncbi:MAG: hypothetical protein A2Y74_06855 [Actinobacteria bacterium RBG_13_63_9]|nr:MAG: hypothetical protein A2Y74_06855 [Actinobacteria bacterium RBG_13_63_9]
MLRSQTRSLLVASALLAMAMLPGAKSALALPTQQAQTKIQVDIVVQGFPVTDSDRKGWRLELHNGIDCTGLRIGTLVTQAVPGLGLGRATFYVKPNTPYSVKLVSHPSQSNFTLPGITCANLVAQPGQTLQYQFPAITKNFPFLKVTEVLFRSALTGYAVAKFSFVPGVGWVVAGAAITLSAIGIAQLIQSDPSVSEATLAIHYPEGCEGPNVYSLPELNYTYLTPGEQRDQTIDVPAGDVVCDIDPNGKPVTFSLVFGGYDASGQFTDGLAVGVATALVGADGAVAVGGIAELLDPAQTPAPSGPPYGVLIGGLAAAVVALTAGAWYARRQWWR